MPKASYARYAKSDNPQLWGWSLFAELPWDEIQVYQAKTQLYRQATTTDDKPFRAIAQDLRKRLVIPEEKLKGFKEEFVEGYRREFFPALEHYWDFIKAENCFYIDFDGDGAEEIVAHVEIPDGWLNQAFIVLLHRQPDSWKIAYFNHLDHMDHIQTFMIDDFDGDGRPELMIQGSIIAGWSWEQMWIFDETSLDQPFHLLGHLAKAIEDPRTGRPVFVDGCAHNPTGGGKYAYLATSFGSVFGLHFLEHGGRWKEVTVHTKQSVW